MEITDVAVATVEATRRFGFGTSTCGLVALTADDGSTGVGEIPDVEDPDAAPPDDAVAAELADFLVGRDPRRLNALTAEMYEAVDLGPFAFHSFQQLALGAVDTALYDLVGTHHGVPAHQLLGGEVGPVPVAWVVFTRGTADELDALAEEVRAKVAEGFSAFKLKVGDADPDVDEARVATVREIAGGDATVLLDAQGHWTAEEAVDRIRRFEPYDVDGVETPVGHPDPDADAPGHYYDVPLVPSDIAAVRERVDVPLVEHVLDPAFGYALAAADAVDVFTVEVCSGGIDRARRILTLAGAAGIDARLGSTVELGPGTLAATTLAASSTDVTYPCDLVGPALYEEDVLETPVAYDGGTLSPRDRPGFGIDLGGDRP